MLKFRHIAGAELVGGSIWDLVIRAGRNKVGEATDGLVIRTGGELVGRLIGV